MSIDIFDSFRSDALVGKSILVAGGGSGPGNEISKALVAKGAAVHICGRRAGVPGEAVSEIAACGSAPVLRHFRDVHDAEHVESMTAAVWKAARLTGLVNNPAANFVSPTKDLSSRRFRAIMSIAPDGSFSGTLGAGTRWISSGLCDLFVLAAKTDSGAGAKGITPFSVESKREGFNRGNIAKLGMKAQDASQLSFENVRAIAGGKHERKPDFHKCSM
jgi:NAD(P)-dependent dehydrogenase (short-subunit alcohol dehydrogenase family)